MAEFYVTHTRRTHYKLSTRWGAKNRGQYYKSYTPETLSYGPFSTRQQAEEWANWRGVMDSTIQDHGIGWIISPKQGT